MVGIDTPVKYYGGFPSCPQVVISKAGHGVCRGGGVGATPAREKWGTWGSLLPSVGSDHARSCATVSPAPYLLPMV